MQQINKIIARRQGVDDNGRLGHIKKHNPGLGTRQIDKLLNLSRNTVKQALQRSEVPEYERKGKSLST